MTFNFSEIGKILRMSLWGAWKWSVWKWLLFPSLSGFASTLQLGEKLFKFDIIRSAKYAAAIVLVIYLIRFLLIFAKECIKYFHEVYKNSVYGDAIILLKDSFASAHYYRKTDGHDDKEFMKSMIIFCNNLKDIFDKITKSECSISIKVPLADNVIDEKTILVNLTRDIKNRSRDTQNYTNTKHTIIGNTPFISAFNKVVRNNKEKHYLNNSVNNTNNYDNTSKDCYDQGLLPYNSELVFPIIPIIKDDNKNFDCHGFICVDSKSENSFNGKYDVAILEGVADGLYDIISQRNQSKNN